MTMKYGDKIIYMEGVIVEIHDGCVGIDLKGRLGYLKIPMRMLITDYPLSQNDGRRAGTVPEGCGESVW